MGENCYSRRVASLQVFATGAGLSVDAQKIVGTQKNFASALAFDQSRPMLDRDRTSTLHLGSSRCPFANDAGDDAGAPKGGKKVVNGVDRTLHGCEPYILRVRYVNMTCVNMTCDFWSMSDMHARLKEARKKAGFNSAMSAAERFRWKKSTYAAHENGQNKFGPDTAASYGHAFKVRASWLLTGEDAAADAPERLPVESAVDAELGWRPPNDTILEIDVRIGAGGGGIPIDAWMIAADGNTYAAEGIRDKWQLPPSVTSGLLHASPSYLRVFEVIGNSMEPRLYEGDRVFIDTRYNSPSPEGIFALFDGYGLVIKQLQVVRGSDPLQVRIISSNEQYPAQTAPLDEIRVIGRYVGRFTVM